jgi:cobalamin biosynthesis protein CobW
VLVVSGFLGAGKTSLVRHLLREAQRTGLRAAVVSNELGELGIDQALLGQAGAEGWVELAGGCVCCRLSDAFVDSLQALFERARPERVIVETSGVALPYETQRNLWREPVANWVGDDVAVVVVSAEQLREGRDLTTTFEQQVSGADLLLLNKLDLVDAAERARLEALLRAIEPEAPIVGAVRGLVAPELLFPPDPEGARAARRASLLSARPHAHESFETEVLELAAGLSEAELREELRAREALRAKGFVATCAGVRVLQAVGARLELSLPEGPPPPALVGRVVVVRRAQARRARSEPASAGGARSEAKPSGDRTGPASGDRGNR